jgi:DNA-binding CsgD family transcriptional regulator
MPRLSKTQEQARRRLHDLAAGGHAPESLARLMAATLQETIGWDGFRLFGLDERTLLVNRLLAASENDAEARLEWLREVYLALPMTYVELTELARTGLRVVAFQERQEICWGYPGEHLATVAPDDHYRHYHETRSPVGGTLLGIFRANDVAVAAIQAYRRDPRKPFRAGDVTFMQQMSPIVGRALLAALAREQAVLASLTDEPDPSGILIIGREGDVRFSTPAAERWLDAMGDFQHGLPVSIWAAMAHLRATSDGRGAKIVVPTRNAQVEVEASPAGEDGITAIVIARYRPVMLPRVPASWPLTAQERQIVEHLATGKSNREISDALFIGEHTVEWHLRKVYDKLGVRTRQEVMLALFRQEFLPGIEQATLQTDEFA